MQRARGRGVRAEQGKDEDKHLLAVRRRLEVGESRFGYTRPVKWLSEQIADLPRYIYSRFRPEFKKVKKEKVRSA